MEKETSNGLVENLKSVLQSGPYNKAISIINGENSDLKIKENPWEIVPIVTEHIKKRIKHYNLELFNTCTELLDIVSDKAYPDDIILLLIKDIEDSSDEVTVMTLLKPLGKCLKAIPKKRLNYLAWCFNAIQKYLNTVHSVEEASITDTDDALEYDEFETLIMDVMNNLIEFYGSFIDDFRRCDTIEQIECRDLLVRYILLLLGHPFAYLNKVSETILSKQIHLIGRKFVDYVTILTPDVCEILSLKNNYTDDEYVKVSDLAVGVFAYYIFCKEEFLNRTLKVYNNFYIFQLAFEYAVCMIATNYNYLIYEGNKLIASLLNMVEEELPYQLLDMKDHTKFCMEISHIIIYNPIERHRKDSLQTFRKYVMAFETKGRYLIIMNLMRNIINKGFLGYLITFYKDLLVEALDSDRNLTYFSNHNLYNMLILFWELPKDDNNKSSSEVDLMDVSDKLISALNFMRYLLLRDTNNRTNVWDYYYKLDELFFKKLQENIESCRDLYQQRLNELKNKCVETERKKKSNFTVTVQGEDIPDVTLSEEVNTLHSVLTVLDVMESLLERVQTIGNEHYENSQ